MLFILFYLWVLPGMGFLVQSSPFWLFLDPVLLREEITKDSFRSLRYSVLGHEDLWGFRLTVVVVSRIWATWWKDICNVGYGGRRGPRIL